MLRSMQYATQCFLHQTGNQLNHPGCYKVFSAPNRRKGVLGGVITLHKEEEEEEKLRLESYVFSQSDNSPGNEPELEEENASSDE